MISVTFKLFDDDSVREKLTVMSKWEVVFDDARNTNIPNDITERIEDYLRLGESYRLTLEKLGMKL